MADGESGRTPMTVDWLPTVPEQMEAKRLLGSARGEGHAHAFLLHGPAGVGKRTAAFGFAATLLGDERRVRARTHPDLVVIEALGEMIRIDRIRELHRDLHMRPFEADRRVYLIFDAHRMNDDAADALLKDLEEPPLYATIVLVADELGPLPETIRSRCQLVPFRRLSRGAVRSWIGEHAPDLGGHEADALARVAGGRLDRARRLLDPEARARRTALLKAARSVYLAEDFDASAAAAVVLSACSVAAARAKEREEAAIADFDLPAREAETRVRRAARGAEKEELLASLDELGLWFRDLLAVAAGARTAVANADHAAALDEDVLVGRGSEQGAEAAVLIVREAWRVAEEFNVAPGLFLESLFIRLSRAF